MSFLKSFFLLFALIYSVSVNSQQLTLSRMFYPNVTLKADYISSSQISDDARYGLSKTSFFAMVPVQSEVQVGYSLRKKLDLRAVHTVMVGQFSQYQPTIAGIKEPDHGYKTGSLGAIRMQASVKDRLWVYGAGIGITESNETFFKPQPWFWGAAARMRVFGLQSQLIYGTALIYNQKLRLIPIIGFNKRFAHSWRASAILPFVANVNHKVSPWFNIDMTAGVNGYSGGFEVQTPEEKLLRRSNYQHLKIGMAANLHMFTVFNISLDAGMTGFRTLRTFNSALENLESFNPKPAPYVGVSIRYFSSRSSISSRFTKRLGIGDKGLLW